MWLSISKLPRERKFNPNSTPLIRSLSTRQATGSIGMTEQTKLVPQSIVSHLWAEYRTEVVIVIAGFVVMNLIFIAGAFREGSAIDRTAAGQLGDFVGGYIGTVFALISVVLLFATLKNQRRAAQEQNLETKYFELIKMHRDNVAELYLQDTNGRRIFVL